MHRRLTRRSSTRWWSVSSQAERAERRAAPKSCPEVSKGGPREPRDAARTPAVHARAGGHGAAAYVPLGGSAGVPASRGVVISFEGVGGGEPQADAGGDDEGAVEHAHQQEDLALQRLHQLGLARRGFEVLACHHAHAQARADGAQADHVAHGEGDEVEAFHVASPCVAEWFIECKEMVSPGHRSVHDLPGHGPLSARPHSALMPRLLMISPSTAVSAFMRWARPSGVPPTGCQPAVSRRARVSGFFITSATAAATRATTGAGRLAGPTSAVQTSRSVPVTPASRNVGTPGARSLWVGEVTAMAFSLPAFTCGSAMPGGNSESCTWPPISADTTCG